MILPTELQSRRPTWKHGLAVTLADGCEWSIPSAKAEPSGDGVPVWRIDGKPAPPEVVEAAMLFMHAADDPAAAPGDSPAPYLLYAHAMLAAAILRVNYDLSLADAATLLSYGFQARGDFAGLSAAAPIVASAIDFGASRFNPERN